MKLRQRTLLIACVLTSLGLPCLSTAGPPCMPDVTPPMILCSSNITASTSSNQCSNTVSYDPPAASDDCALASTNCAPASGSMFTNGVTTVTCTAVDAAGNTNTCSFTVTVNDNEPPALVCPSNVTVAANTGLCTKSNVVYGVTATDNCPGVGLDCVPPSGTNLFALGSNSVTCTATDAASNSTNCTFDVIVTDTQLPVIGCPGDLVFIAATDEEVEINYSFPSMTDNCGLVSSNCAPPSGTILPPGVTNGLCTAVDGSGNTNTCSFQVSVFDLCFQDDVTGDLLLLSSVTGDYVFTWNEFDVTVTGQAEIRQPSATLIARSKELTHSLKFKWNAIKNSARGKVVFPTVRRTVQIRDADVSDNDCE